MLTGMSPLTFTWSGVTSTHSSWRGVLALTSKASSIPSTSPRTMRAATGPSPTTRRGWRRSTAASPRTGTASQCRPSWAACASGAPPGPPPPTPPMRTSRRECQSVARRRENPESSDSAPTTTCQASFTIRYNVKNHMSKCFKGMMFD